MSSAPPPLPKPTQSVPQPAIDDSAQRVFDTVAGPNIRLKDNLIQLICVVVGGGAGAIIGAILDAGIGALVGAVLGLVAALFVSGAIIGVIRFRRR